MLKEHGIFYPTTKYPRQKGGHSKRVTLARHTVFVVLERDTCSASGHKTGVLEEKKRFGNKCARDLSAKGQI